MTDEIFIQAAQIYRTLRTQGVTVRKPVDCMIAATALTYKARLLHNDRDFTAIGQHYPLQIIILSH